MSCNRKPRFRTARRQAMKAEGILPCRRQWVWLVQPDQLYAVPEWARRVAVRGLGEVPGRVWLWWVDARRLLSESRKAGWRCDVTRTELRHCAVCSRPFVGIEAERRRRLDESSPEGRLLPCGEACARDRESGVWQKLNPYARTVGTRARVFRRAA